MLTDKVANDKSSWPLKKNINHGGAFFQCTDCKLALAQILTVYISLHNFLCSTKKKKKIPQMKQLIAKDFKNEETLDEAQCYLTCYLLFMSA